MARKRKGNMGKQERNKEESKLVLGKIVHFVIKLVRFFRNEDRILSCV